MDSGNIVIMTSKFAQSQETLRSEESGDFAQRGWKETITIS